MGGSLLGNSHRLNIMAGVERMKSRMSVVQYRRRFPDRPEPIGMEYQGKWIAWNQTGRRIVAAADHLDDLRQIVSESKTVDPIFQKVPQSMFLGGAWSRF
ncbi:MAG: hypothetical protein KF861_15025 [Planctomycetaceae bacterium]|nr:hypothetical protein [Planctomycetaceae bacterium]